MKKEKKLEKGNGSDASICSVVLIGGKCDGQRMDIPQGMTPIMAEKQIPLYCGAHEYGSPVKIETATYTKRVFMAGKHEIDFYVHIDMTEAQALCHLRDHYKPNVKALPPADRKNLT